MRLSKWFPAVMLVPLLSATGWGQEREPHIGYLYPAGGQRGTTVSVCVGGQFLERTAGVYISGDGVSAKVSGYEGPFGILTGPQFQELMNRLKDLRDKRMAEEAAKKAAAAAKPGAAKSDNAPAPAAAKPAAKSDNAPAPAAAKPAAKSDSAPAPAAKSDNAPAPAAKSDNAPAPAAAKPAVKSDSAAVPAGAKPGAAPAKRPPVVLPDLPEIRNLDQMTLAQLRQLTDKFNQIRNNRPKPPLGETAILEVTISPEAALGDREIRLRTPAGITNPMLFEVGQLPEVREPNRNVAEAEKAALQTELQPPRPAPATAGASSAAGDLGVVSPPVVLNGQILGGQVDRFRLRARRGQKLVITTEARRLVPYLADAVPGWFQAIVTLSDANGRELAAADHYRYDPDPVLFFDVPEDGEYGLEIHDTIYRGRADFIYRITVAEQPFITQMFPLGGREGTATTASISGWNLSERRLRLDTQAGYDHVRLTEWRGKDGCSNSVKYAVDALPECDAIASSAALRAQDVTLPQIINGRISHPGDTNVVPLPGARRRRGGGRSVRPQAGFAAGLAAAPGGRHRGRAGLERRF